MSIRIPSTRFYSQTEFRPPALVPGVGSRAALGALRREHRLQIFSFQQAAIDVCDAQPQLKLRVWSFEINGTGCRKFVAASYENFWRYYSASIRRRVNLHYYEVLRERHACKVYFDLEYLRKENPNADGERMVDMLISKCAEVCGISFHREDENLIELDSTTEKKFSRHLVFLDIAFFDNVQIGEFARMAVQAVMDTDQSMMLVRKADGSMTPFVDLAVYTKNRCFRLVGSSKYGKTQRLLPKETDVLAFSKCYFMRSLVCTVTKRTTLRGRPSPFLLPPSPKSQLSRRGTARQTSFSRISRGSSPYLHLDDYILGIIGQCNGDIYGISMVGDSSIIYAIKGGYKYCANIGRHHKSNNVMLVADVNARHMTQKCFDPDCRGFQSPAWPIPPCVFGDGQSDSVDDDALCDMMEQFEEGQPEDYDGDVNDAALHEMMDRAMEGRQG